MNERGDYFCAITGATPLTTGAGGSHADGSCRPPAEMVVDWVFGSPGLTWTGYAVLRDQLSAPSLGITVEEVYVRWPSGASSVYRRQLSMRYRIATSRFAPL